MSNCSTYANYTLNFYTLDNYVSKFLFALLKEKPYFYTEKNSNGVTSLFTNQDSSQDNNDRDKGDKGTNKDPLKIAGSAVGVLCLVAMVTVAAVVVVVIVTRKKRRNNSEYHPLIIYQE